MVRMKKRLIPIVLFLSLVGLGGLSLVSIHNLQGNARVINYTGVVRGATQRLVKEELKGRADDALIARLDGIMAVSYTHLDVYKRQALKWPRI